MISVQENERLTRIGPGAPMGALLRRYWMPIAISADVAGRPVARRLLGEDLVVFRSGDGKVGVVDRQCPHRRADLAVGVCEQTGLRCGYHGWMYRHDGQCVEQPAEPRLNPNMKIKAYPAEELGGLVWAYMGPAPAPLLPRFDLFVRDGVARDIGHAMLDLNWLQAMENSVDPHHVEWLHGRFMNYWRALDDAEQSPILAKKHVKVGFDEFEYGIIKRRVVEGGTEEDDDWKIGHPLVFPITLRVGSGGVDQFQIRVPIDDTHTWHIWYTVYAPSVPVPEQAQRQVPSYEVPLFNAKGERILDFVDGQDIAAWAGQGVIADRSKESLATSDVGVKMLRRMLKAQMARVEAGQDPLGTVRDPARNQCIDLPMEREKYGGGAAFRDALFTFQAIRHSPIRDQMRELFRQGGTPTSAKLAQDEPAARVGPE